MFVIHSQTQTFYAIMALAILSGACDSKGPSWHHALPLGNYRLSSSVCKSTGTSPAYPDAAHKTALLEFDDIEEHSLTVTYGWTTEVFKTKNCTLQIKRSVFRNYDGIFSQQRNRKYQFEPQGCELSVTYNERRYAASPAYTSIFTDSTDVAEEIPFHVTPEGEAYRLTSMDHEELRSLWQKYGCGTNDQLTMQAVPISPS